MSNNYGNVYAGTETLQDYILNVFTKMCTALVVTALVAYFGYRNLATGGQLAWMFYRHPGIAIGILVVQLVLCVLFTARITTMSPVTATTMFYMYAVITGVTFSFLPYAYGVGNVFTAFAFSAVMFASCAVIGHTTKVDMTRFSGILLGGLLAMVLIAVLSIFIPFLRDSLAVNFIGVGLFLALTAYDIQRIKQFYYGTAPGDVHENLAIYGAFELYLDFLNLFLRILRIVSRNRRN